MSRVGEFSARWLRRAAQLGVVGFGVAVVFGWFGWVHPAFDSFATFRMFFGAALLGSLIVLLPFRRWTWFASGAALLVVSVALTFPHLPGVKRGWAVEGAAPLEGKPRLRVAQANILFSIVDPEKTVASLLRDDPDVILLQEVSRDNGSILEVLNETHPHQLDCREGRYHSVAIVSRLPLTSPIVDPCPDPGGLGIGQIDLAGTPVNLVSFHAWWPWPMSQHRQISMLSEHLESLDGPTILAGDFNASPWSNGVARVAGMSGTQVPAGLLNTWKPSGGTMQVSEARVLPLDHMLHSPEFGLISRELLPSGGSDHHPVVSEYVLLN
ncbi:MAG: endonuclease/exonuclease/phosphatase family protein [Pseudomonadota bacterium]